MIRLPYLISVLLVFGIGCNSSPDSQKQSENRWLASLDLGEEILPFVFELDSERMVIRNADERVVTSSWTEEGDTMVFKLPVHQTEIRARLLADKMQGYLFDHGRSGNYKIPFSAQRGNQPRFATGGSEKELAGDNWKITFPGNTADQKTSFARGHFRSENGVLYGTMMTPTGDYRYLEGTVDSDELNLSCFDGAHVFLFKADRMPDGSLSGNFWSGNHWKEPWTAVRDPEFRLPDSDAITFLTGNDKKLPNLCFENLQEEVQCLQPGEGKVQVIQILGSWCPNCRDETEFFSTALEEYHDKDFEIISLAFERGTDPLKWRSAAQKMKSDLHMDWKVLLAGTAGKNYASSLFPEFNSISSFPTTIFADKNGQIRRIHTGFNGPATGQEYERFKTSFHATIQELLAE